MAPGLNVLTAALRDYCREHVLEEKVILAPSRRLGFQWLDAVARSGQPLFNARADTLRHIALRLTAHELESLGLRLLTGLRLEVLVDSLVRDMLEGPAEKAVGEAYLAGLVPSPGLTRTIAVAIRELRLAGIRAEGVDPSRFEVERKGREVQSILAAYERLLEERGLADYPTVVRLATELLNHGAPTPAEVLLMPQDVAEDLRGLEIKLWNSIPPQNRVVLPVDRPGVAPEGEPLTDSMLLRWVSEPTSAPGPCSDSTARITSSIGEVNEVREVFRACVSRGVPLDQVEVVYTDREVYVPHFYELAVRLLQEGSDDLPVTFSEGIPARYSRPGRALAAWLDWASEGYSQQHMVRMIQDGLLNITGAREMGFSFSRLGALLRTVPVGAGLERYADELDRAAATLRRRLGNMDEVSPGTEAHEAAADVNGDDQHTLTPSEVNRMKQRLEGYGLLGDLVRDLAQNAPASRGDQRALLEQARYFLVRCSRSVSKMDAYAAEALLERIGELAECLDESGSATFDIFSWLADLPVSVRVGGQGPRPGCLHVSNIQQGGHSGRPNTFAIGMDDTRFPGAGLQDALLLDSERAALSPDLSTAAGRIDMKVQGFARLMARLRGDTTLTYCCRSLADEREMFPSRVLVSAYGAMMGENAGAFDLGGIPTSFAPAREEQCIDMTEWWLWRMCAGGPVNEPGRVMSENFANLAEGFKALEARASNRFTEYDGYVPEAGADSDCTVPGGPVISPSRLGTLAANPMEYFFRHILKIEPPEEFEVDPTRWLDPLETGTLLHDVFCDFIRELQGEKMLPPVFDRDREALLAMLDMYVEQKKAEKPPPADPTVFAIEYQSLRDTAESFLQMEAEFCLLNEPVACEMAVGVQSEGGGTTYDIEDSVDVQLPGGKSVRIRCKLDRVDRATGGSGDEYVVCDYKTGKSERYRKNGPFYEGRFMQAALYPVAGEAALRRQHSDARVVRFEYVFPKPSEAKRLRWYASELGGGMQILTLLCEMIAAGCFAFTNNVDDIKYSDYVAAFGDIPAAVKDIDAKLDNPANTALDAYRALRAAPPPATEVEQ